MKRKLIIGMALIVALFLAVLSCNLIGEGVRDLLDPRGARR